MSTLIHRWMSNVFACLSAFALSGIAGCSYLAPHQADAAATAMQQASAVRCDRGLTRIELVGGVEDGFAQAGIEPARIRPARFPNAYLDAISAAQSGVMQLRDYDEIGQDRILIDHFAIPRDIVSGAIIVRLRTTGGSVNDAIKIGNLDERAFGSGFAKADAASYSLSKEAGNPVSAGPAGVVVTVPFKQLSPNPRASFKGTFIDYLNRADRPDEVDFEVEDDTAIDVAILVACQKPQVERGTSFAEYRGKFIAPDVSFLTCFLDRTQAPCNPFEGDHVCTAALPVACYKPGKSVPDGLAAAGLGQGYSPGGEVRASPAMPGNSFATRAAADSYCAGQFGPGWRILEYHDGAGGAIATYSNIAPQTRLWVDVSDQRYGNCWDRTKVR